MLLVKPLFQTAEFLIQFLELLFPIFALYGIGGIGIWKDIPCW